MKAEIDEQHSQKYINVVTVDSCNHMILIINKVMKNALMLVMVLHKMTKTMMATTRRRRRRK
jgi:hypothetical protein